jgi:hypothetical protein
MQDRYVGDVGDYGKYGLLRALRGRPAALRLGVVWYRVPDESHTRDGRFLGYLDPTADNHARFRACDPELFDGMASVIRRSRRIEEVQTTRLLGDTTRYFAEPLAWTSERVTDRAEQRRSWLARGVSTIDGSNIVFVDPDNGIECASVTRTSAKGPKYAFLDEIEYLYRATGAIVIYHHLSRRGSATQQAMRAIHSVQRATGGDVWALRFHRGTSRLFVIATAPSDGLLRERTREFLATSWREHFTLLA